MCSTLLQMRCEDVKISVDIKDRLTIIRGDSGTCKSYLVDKIFANDSAVEITVPMAYLRFPTHAMHTIQTTRDVLFIVDDELFLKDRKARAEFQRYLTDVAVMNNLYFLIIDRSTVALKNLPYSAYSICDMIEVSPHEFVGKPACT